MVVKILEKANCVDSDQTAPKGTESFESILFAFSLFCQKTSV